MARKISKFPHTLIRYSGLPHLPKLPLCSISEILDKVQEDAEDVLFSLGFGQEDHKDTSRIPSRFFTTPSQAKGIDFQLFLKAQVRRIEMEDPCLMLASECYHRSGFYFSPSLQTLTGINAPNPTSSWSGSLDPLSLLRLSSVKMENFNICSSRLKKQSSRDLILLWLS